VRNLFTIRPTSVGWKRFFSRATYSRFTRVEMIEAYVEGRPMPNCSRAFTRLASE